MITQKKTITYPARSRFPKRAYRQILRAYRCRCAVCAGRLTRLGGVEFDHVIAIALDGPDTLDNLRPLCPSCHKHKTRSDQKLIAKNRRLQRQHDGKPKRNKLRRKMDGTVVDDRDGVLPF